MRPKTRLGVMLNDCISTHWSPVCQYSALTSLEDSPPFASKAQSWFSKALDTDRRLYFSLPYFGFRTSVSILRFPHFSIFHLPFLKYAQSPWNFDLRDCIDLKDLTCVLVIEYLALEFTYVLLVVKENVHSCVSFFCEGNGLLGMFLTWADEMQKKWHK